MSCRMSTANAQCAESADPRHAGHCYRCGGPVESEPEPDPRTAQDPVFQRGFLKGAEKVAGLETGWADEVSDRLSRMQAKYGERYRMMPMSRLLREIDEESFDLGGWPVLAAQRVNAEDHLDPDTVLEIKHLLQQVSALAVRQSHLVGRIRELML